MRLKLVNSESEYILSKNFIPTISAYKRRTGVQKRYGKDGGVPTGDQMADTRDITLQYQPVADDDSTYIDTVNEIIGFFRQDLAPFYLVDTDNDRRTEIILNSATDEAQTEGLEYRIGKNNLKFEMLDAFWEDNTENVISSPTGGLASGDILTIDNDSYIECYPIITITPYEINTDLTIRNITTGAAFILGSNSFVPGSQFIINSQTGEITLELSGSSIEMSSALADGSGFIKLIPGENQLQYSSVFGDVDIEVAFRRRFAV